MKKKSVLVFIVMIFLAVVISGCKKSENKEGAISESPKIIASTSWTAAFAYLGGADQVDIVAPVNLRHPPEYEITAGDVVKIMDCDYFVYAGFERMMETLGELTHQEASASAHQGGGSAEKGPVLIKIRCDNSLATVSESAGKIAEALGTVEESQKRVARYVEAVEGGRRKMEEMGLKGTKVLCNKNQKYLATELGFEVAGIFGPGPVSSGQIEDAKNGEYDFIIDNIHNPVGGPLKEVAPKSKYIIWRNFPETVGEDTLLKLIEENINKIY